MLTPHAIPHSFIHAVRTAVAAFLSLEIARLCKLPESYWATITALIVMQSTFGAAFIISMQRLAGTALGAILGAIANTWFDGNVIAYGLVILATGMICLGLKFERNAYRYASITVAIIMLAASKNNPWVIAIHRFIEVAIGIGVALLLAAAWPEKVNGAKEIDLPVAGD